MQSDYFVFLPRGKKDETKPYILPISPADRADFRRDSSRGYARYAEISMRGRGRPHAPRAIPPHTPPPVATERNACAAEPRPIPTLCRNLHLLRQGKGYGDGVLILWLPLLLLRPLHLAERGPDGCKISFAESLCLLC